MRGVRTAAHLAGQGVGDRGHVDEAAANVATDVHLVSIISLTRSPVAFWQIKAGFYQQRMRSIPRTFGKTHFVTLMKLKYNLKIIRLV